MKDFAGKVAVVTGANSGIGLASAPADERGRIDYSYRLYNNPDGHARVQRVQRK